MCTIADWSGALARGVSAAFASIGGVLVGDVFLMLLSLMGLGAILGSSEVLFQMVKWAGVIYMAYLGYSQIIEARRMTSTSFSEPQPGKKWACFKAGFLSAALNPKGIMFYLAFLPQFMVPTGNTEQQILILLASSTFVVAAVLAMYVLAAAKAKKLLFGSKAAKRINYISGGCLFGGSAMMAVLR
ncbi:LysE family translocator [Kiloniella antarctica]|uniref:LysE family translocator n=1 Tax=Kiloniella antarctica TaxID=1550907 RepID=A0ABW5BK62_9PROT